jgi:cytoskeletal protein RodZ
LGAFGEKLRKQRELRGIELDAISNTTKISTRMLRALEDERFDQLPGGVFNKGFVRAYARQVGLNEEETIADYLAALRDTQIQAHSTSPHLNNLPGTDLREKDLHGKDLHGKDLRGKDLHGKDLPGKDLPGKDLPGKDLPHTAPAANNTGHDPSRQLLTNDRRKRRRNEDRRNEDRRNQGRRKEDPHNVDGRYKDLSFLPSSSTSGPAGRPAADRFRQKYPAGDPEQQPSHHERSVQIPWGKLAVALLLVTFALALWNSRRHRDPKAAPQSTVASNPSPASTTVTAATPPSQSRSATSLPVDKASVDKASPAPASPSGKLSGGTVSAASQTESTTAAVTMPRASAPAPPPGKLSLLIRAEETAWVSIVADGKPVAQETLIAPAHTSVRASGEVVVKTGNAAGLSFQLNGKEIPAQGDEGEVKTYIFDAAGVRVLAPDR